MANIQPKDLTFCDGFVKFLCQGVKRLYIERVNYVYIAKLENKYCPVAILRRYIEAPNFDLSSHLPLFRPFYEEQVGLCS